MKYIKPRSVFVFENMDKAKSIFNKKVQDFEKLKDLLKKNLGYIGKFTEYLLSENIPYEELENLYKELTNLQKRQSPIDIEKLSYEKALDQVQLANEDLAIKRLMNSLPSEQKNYTKDLISNYRSLLIKVANSPNLETFLSKVSRYKSIDELKNAYKVFSKNRNNDRESVKNFVKGSNKSEISFENDDILIVKIGSYSDIKELGSDTSWCIVPSESTFNSYTKGRLQYIVYDYTKDEFDPNFKIGVTLEKNGYIHACHNILDYKSNSEFKNILEKNGISTTDIIPKVELKSITDTKINKVTDFKSLGDGLGEIKKESVLDLMKKACSLGEIKSGPKEWSKTLFIKKCWDILFGEKDWVLIEDLKKLGTAYTRDSKGKTKVAQGWPVYSEFRNNNSLSKLIDNLVNEEFNPKLRESAFLKGIEVWKDESIFEYFKYFNHDIIKNLEKINDKFSKDTMEKLASRIENIYQKLDRSLLDSSDLSPVASKKFGKSGKEAKDFELAYLLINKIIGKEVSGYKELIAKHKRTIHIYGELRKYFQIELDANEIHYLMEEDIPNIIKKDYDNIHFSIVYYKPNKLNSYNKLIDHLKGHKINFKIYGNHVSDQYAMVKGKEGVIPELLSKLNDIKPKRKGSSVSIGDVSMTIA